MQLSAFSARNARLTDITFDHLLISTGNASHTIPIHPSMTSWSDARPRVVAMDAEAVAGLKRPNVTLKRYELPSAVEAIAGVVVVILIALFSRKANFHPGSLLYDNVFCYVPALAHGLLTLRFPVLTFLAVSHPIEAWCMMFVVLRKYSVPMFSAVWWKWTLSIFVLGFGEFSRIDRMAKADEKAKLNAKH